MWSEKAPELPPPPKEMHRILDWITIENYSKFWLLKAFWVTLTSDWAKTTFSSSDRTLIYQSRYDEWIDAGIKVPIEREHTLSVNSTIRIERGGETFLILHITDPHENEGNPYKVRIQKWPQN